MDNLLIEQYNLHKPELNDEQLINLQVVTGGMVACDVWKTRTNNQSGIHLPWNTLQDLFWLVKSEMTIVSGYSGHGKSAFVNQIALAASINNVKTFIASLELTPGELWNRICIQTTGMGLTAPYEYVTATTNFYDQKLFTLDLVGSADVEKVLNKAQELVDRGGVELFIFDNLMMLNSLVDDFKVQHAITDQILRFAQKNNVHVVLVAHSRKPSVGYGKSSSTNLPVPGMYDVSGSSNIVNMVHNHLSISKNSLKIQAQDKLSQGIELTEEDQAVLKLGDTIINRDKARSIGKNFRRFLHFCEKFERFADYHSEWCNCKPYFEYSKQKG